ncbi:hypothetical protein K2173_001267 [Erythroxylum novogranatense]|uniref:Secreted protein n=1 Tax=Erythroxylum novogranatense TaxID=1862640 RepID=A0AAV8T383_9ROSI|nr:hypothetical protein K2173_001267 [Erythroxylum novogranatense]
MRFVKSSRFKIGYQLVQLLLVLILHRLMRPTNQEASSALILLFMIRLESHSPTNYGFYYLPLEIPTTQKCTGARHTV